jgi:hypothetical protein
MNRSQIILIVMPFLLIFGYQNCQKSNFESSKNSVSSTAGLEAQSISLANESVQRIQFKSNKVVQVVRGASSFSVVKNFLYDFDLVSGDFYVKDIQADISEKYCLPEALKNQINLLLSSSSVCKYSAVRTNDQVCTQVIQDGYANLITNRDQFSLGYSSDSCGSNRVDFCGDPAQIKMWFENIKPLISSLVCQ